MRQPAASPFTARRSGSEIPRDEALDSSLALLREGYAFIPARCRRLASDLFETRIMLSKAVCMSGAEAAAEFYRPDRFTRRHAMPPSAFTLIQDNGSVMALDGEAHRRRKAMFLSVMRPERLGRFVELVEARFRDRLQTWPRRPRIILFEEANLALCAAVCEWAGLDLTADEIALRSAEFAAMIDGTGSIGPRNWKGHLLRARSERWARGLIRSAREGRIAAPKGSALEAISTYREADGQELDLASAGVELINVLRPTVANARYVAFAAIALHEHPAARRQVASDGEALESFVQEVRRFYPFIPFMAGRVVEPFAWRGRAFNRGEWVLLDIYGSNRDPRSWSEPESFRSDRFRGWKGDAYAFIPSGGGPHETTHRCPGEWMTIESVKTIVRLLASEVRYELPPQDLTISLSRIPALPASHVALAHARPASS